MMLRIISGLCLFLAWMPFTGAQQTATKVATVLQTPGLVAFWDFVERRTANADLSRMFQQVLRMCIRHWHLSGGQTHTGKRPGRIVSMPAYNHSINSSWKNAPSFNVLLILGITALILGLSSARRVSKATL